MLFFETNDTQTKRRDFARLMLDRVDIYRRDEDRLEANELQLVLQAVIEASVDATRKTTAEFAGRLAHEAVIIGDLTEAPQEVSLWRPSDWKDDLREMEGWIIETDDCNALLDIIACGDRSSVTVEEYTSATETWSEGSVLHINHESPILRPALLVPHGTIQPRIVNEALSRYFTQPVSPFENIAYYHS